MMLVFLRWKLCLSQRCQCLETYQGCALIGGSPVFGTCEIQGAQHMLRFFEKAKISKKPKNLSHCGHSSFYSKIKRLSLLQHPPPLSTQCTLDAHRWTQLALNHNVDVSEDIIHGLTWSADQQSLPRI